MWPLGVRLPHRTKPLVRVFFEDRLLYYAAPSAKVVALADALLCRQQPKMRALFEQVQLGCCPGELVEPSLPAL